MKKSNLKWMGDLQPSKPTVLLLPGGMTNPDIYDGIVNEIPWQYAKIDWQRSEGSCDVLEVADRVLLFIEEQKLGPTVLVGYSAGGVISLAAAINDSGKGRIVGLMLSNTGANAIGHGDPKMPQKILEQWGTPEFMENFINRCFSKPVAPELKEKLISYAATVSNQSAYESSYSLRQHNLEPLLSKIDCPVVIAHGEEDKARTVAHANCLKEGIKNSELFFLKGGHSIFVEDRENWVKAFHHLLRRIKC